MAIENAFCKPYYDRSDQSMHPCQALDRSIIPYSLRVLGRTLRGCFSLATYKTHLERQNANEVYAIRTSLRNSFRKPTQVNLLHFPETSRTPGYNPKAAVENILAKQSDVVIQTEIPSPVWNEMDTVEGLFNHSKDQVTQLWDANEMLGGRVTALCNKWSAGIKDTPSNADLKQALKDPKTSTLLAINYYGKLEDLNKVNPQAWRTLQMISSERQQASINLTRQWIRASIGTPEFDAFTQRVGMNADELRIVLDLTEITGRMFDIAYMKQWKYQRQLTSGTKPTSIENREDDYARLYAANDSPRLLSDADIFPREVNSIGQWFDRIAESIDQKLESGILPPKDYDKLAQHLRLLSRAHQLTGTDPHAIKLAWDSVEANLVKLLKTDCPIFVFHAREACVGEGKIIDMELRVNMRTIETRDSEKKFMDYAAKVGELNQQYGFDKQPPLLVIANQPSAHGPNSYWRTRGQELNGVLNVVHPEPCKDVARLNELPLIEALLPGTLNYIGYENYLKAAVEETVRHELGHSLAPSEDSQIKARIGASTDMKVIEELKAETVNMLMLDPDNLSPIELNSILLAKIGVCLDVLKNKSSVPGSSGERYYYPGIVILDRLLDSNVILRKENGTYTIQNAKQGIVEIAKMAEELLNSCYFNAECKPEVDIPARVVAFRKLPELKPALKQMLEDIGQMNL